MDDSSPTDQSTRRDLLKKIGATGFVAGLAGCSGQQGGGGQTTQEGTPTPSPTPTPKPGMAPSELPIDDIQPDKLISTGPNGHKPKTSDAVSLSPKQVRKVQKGDYTVSIVFHYLKSAWTRLQREGLKTRLSQLGINIEGVYGANFNANKQVNVLNTLESKADQIDGVISIPVDPVATADAYKGLAESGVDIVFMDNVPKGFNHPQDYAGVVAADNKGNGIIAGKILAKLVGKGKVGLIVFDPTFYVVDQREKGVKQVLKNHPDVDIGVTQGFSKPDNVYTKAQNMLTANPDLKGLWAAWGNPPAMQAVSAANSNNRQIPITTIDLGSRVANNMAEQGLVKGLGAQRPYDQGVTEANMMGHSLLGNETPPFIAVQSLAVARKNLLDAYRKVFHKDPPKKITKHFED